MKSILHILLATLAASVSAHDLSGDAHSHYDWSVQPPGADPAVPVWFLAQADRSTMQNPLRGRTDQPAPAAVFAAFAPRVKVRWDERFLFIESNGLPAHGMMVGITAWQQQVPLPQNYTGANAWQIPLAPVPSKTPVSIKGRFLRGAIALAVNGIPIFNPQNNRGEVSQEIGELDEWGGHCGRADDYHYHAAPLHLQDMVGKGQPIAYALDGYPIYGLTEPDGSAPVGLDAFNGHPTSALGYHYHASTKYPYVNGGFHGEVVEVGGQVDPQPRARSVRPDLPPLRSAKITGFTATPDEKTFSLQYSVNGKSAAVNYATSGGGSWKFQFVGADGTKREETYSAGERRGGGPPPTDNPPPRASPSVSVQQSGTFALRSSAVGAGGALPVEYTGDGPGSTLPLEWSGAPAGTKSYALIMHHLDREGKTKWYWTLYDIPADVTHLDKNTRGVGTLGRSFKGQAGYEPPHSQGPGAKTYVLTLYALSSASSIDATGPVTGEVLTAAIKDRTLASADLNVVYSRAGPGENQPPARPGEAR
jgi:phosphatidylethanolamine-binding protein (PEBP) family uncharacterized protein